MRQIAYSAFFLLLIPAALFASAPFAEQTQLSPLVVSWDSEVDPVKIGLNGQIVTVREAENISFARKKYPEERIVLTVIPRDKNHAPLQLEVPDDKNKIHIKAAQLQAVPRGELWLWGQTPQSQCDGQGPNPAQAQIHFRVLNKKSIYRTVSGLFVWKIKTAELPADPVVYAAPQLALDTPAKISSPVFTKSSAVNYARCKRHRGGDCPFVFDLKGFADGGRFEVKFTKPSSPASGPPGCPI